MKTSNEKIQEHITDLQNLVKGTKAGIIVAYTNPEIDGQTQVLSVGKSMSLASNYIAIQGALKEDAQKSEGCNCIGCSALRAIRSGRIDFDDYEKSMAESTHTFVVNTPDDLIKVLTRIVEGEF